MLQNYYFFFLFLLSAHLIRNTIKKVMNRTTKIEIILNLCLLKKDLSWAKTKTGNNKFIKISRIFFI